MPRFLHHFLLSTVALLASCVTSGDIQRVGYSLALLEQRVGEAATFDDVEAAFGEAKNEVQAVKDEIDERTAGMLSATEGGVYGTLSMAALYLLRELTRMRALSKVAKA